MPKLIIHTEASCGWGGQETRIITELAWLKSAGYRPMLISPKGSEIFARAKGLGVECLSFEFSKWGQPLDIFRLAALFWRLSPHAVATHSTIDSRVGLMAAKLAGVPVKLRYRHVSVPVVGTPLNRFVYGSCADLVVTTGDCISGALSRSLHLEAEHFRTIATGIAAPDEMLPREIARKRLCEQLKLPADARFVGCVAILRSWKGHHFLLDAFELVHKQFPTHHLIFVGDGPAETELKTHLAKLACGSRVHLVGRQSNVYDYFRAFDLAVLPSYAGEGIPQTILQAFFAQTPVVATTTGGIPEVVEHGKTGLLCEPKSAGALARIIEEALGNTPAALARAQTAYAQAMERHTVAAMGAALEEIIGQPK